MEKKNNPIIRIALLGPESTGKSTLAEDLAEHYKTVWVKEYAREYLNNLKGKYSLDDILTIAKEQVKSEKKAQSKANRFLFSDNELILIKVWCIDLFKSCPDWIVNTIEPNKFDLYLLTYPDIKWEKDPLRENPTRRKLLFNWYERELKKINANYIVVKGQGNMRLQQVIKILEKKFPQQRK